MNYEFQITQFVIPSSARGRQVRNSLLAIHNYFLRTLVVSAFDTSASRPSLESRRPKLDVLVSLIRNS